MPNYYVNNNQQSTGEHEVHQENCSYFPYPRNAIYLGEFSYCQSAIAAAKIYYQNVDGCYYCCNECHTR